MTKPKNDFKIYNETDKKCYFYNITDYMKYIMGDFIIEADILMGYIFTDDTDFVQQQDFNKFNEMTIKKELKSPQWTMVILGKVKNPIFLVNL